MIHFPVVLQDNYILYDLSLSKVNGIHGVTPLSSWLTPYGLVIPVTPKSINLVGYLRRGDINTVNITIDGEYSNLMMTSSGLLLTHRKELYFVIVTHDYVICHWVPYGEGCKHVYADVFATEAHVSALFSVNCSNQQILEYFNKHSILTTTFVEEFSIDILHKFIQDNVDKPKEFTTHILKNTQVKKNE